MNLLELIKRAAVDAVEASDPVRVIVGEVMKETPLEIKVDDFLTLDEDYLILCRDVTDYEVQMEVDHQVEKMSGGGGDPAFQSHVHKYKGIKTFKVLNKLKKGEKVIMVSTQGGQKYVVLDRIG